MGQLTFQATLGGQVNLVGPNTASTFNINVPAIAGNMVTTGDTGTVTTAMLASTTGTGAVVLATSPALVTPALGTPTAAVLTNATGLPLTTGVTGTLPVANGGTGVTTSTGSGANVLGTSSTLTTPVINGFTGDTSVVNIGSGQVYKDASGNVGIGTSSPASPSGFIKVVQVSNATSSSVVVGAGGVTAEFGCSSGGGWLSANGANPLRFATNSNEVGRFDSNGVFLVGITTPVIGANSEKFSIRQLGAGLWANSVQIGNGGNATLYTNVSGTASYDAISFRNNGTTFTQVGVISVSGSATSYNTSSDYRLKNTIAPMTGALDKVALLKPCTYKWIVDGSNGQGFIAHELAEVEPGCVTGEKDATEVRTVEVSPATPAEFDAAGVETSPAKPSVTEKQTFPKYQGIDTSFLIATLTAALQEAHGLIKNLEQRVNALEAK